MADEELAKREALRRQGKDTSKARSRSMSASSFSSGSASTVSTNLSRSASPDVRRRSDLRPSAGRVDRSRNPQRDTASRMRRFSDSSQMAYSSESEDLERVASDRRRGKPRDSQSRREGWRQSNDRKRRWSASSLSSYSDSSRDHQRSSYRKDADRNTRLRRSSFSPDERGRDRYLTKNHDDRRERSRGFSREKSMMARNRNSITPGLDGGQHRYGDDRGGDRTRSEHGSRPSEASKRKENNSSSPTNTTSERRFDNGHLSHRARPPRERSLSPYSKRLVLTQTMGSAI